MGKSILRDISLVKFKDGREVEAYIIEKNTTFIYIQTAYTKPKHYNACYYPMDAIEAITPLKLSPIDNAYKKHKDY